MYIVATIGRDNIDVLAIKYTDPVTNVTTPLNFATYGVTRVEVSAGNASISSITSDVTYSGDKLSVKLGKLTLSAGQYDLRIVLFTEASPNGIEIVGKHRQQSINLIMNAS